MRLPESLLRLIEEETGKFDGKTLARAAAELSSRYQREQFSSPVLSSDVHRAAYLAVRLPATFSANANVFREVTRRAGEATVESMLDLGAGPGTALLAAKEVFPGLRRATLLETDQAWLKIGRRLIEQVHPDMTASWLRYDLRQPLPAEAHDLVVISYALGELPRGVVESVIRAAWRMTGRFLVIVEPGTVRGFEIIHSIRSSLITSGVKILAPCPHYNACPMAMAGDWCHFAQRVERTSLHRQLKGGELGFEDEKFSYIVATRTEAILPEARLVRHPRKHSGHIQLTLCTAGKLIQQTVTKSQKVLYRRARKAEWGEGWTIAGTE